MPAVVATMPLVVIKSLKVLIVLYNVYK
jgi:hypothetical protein